MYVYGVFHGDFLSIIIKSQTAADLNFLTNEFINSVISLGNGISNLSSNLG